MMRDQILSAFIAQLLLAGVEPEQVERAVASCIDIKLGHSISGGDPLVRAFAFEQATRLEKGCLT